MNKDYIDALWHEAELASVNSDLEIHQIFYKLIEKNIRADEREECAKFCEKYIYGNVMAMRIREKGKVK